MDFGNRLKKELTEGIVRSLLKDAGYRVIDFGIENTLREVECLSVSQYLKLCLPDCMRSMPDLVVMDKDQTVSHMVEVKYRNGWTVDLFNDLEEQVRILKKMTLIYVNGLPPEDKRNLQSPSRNIRCCLLLHKEGEFLFQGVSGEWQPVNSLRTDENQWWGMNLLQNVFPLFHERNSEQTISKAVNAIRSVLA